MRCTVLLMVLPLLCLAACDRGGVAAATAQAPIPPDPGETPAQVMSDAEAASAEAAARQMDREAPAEQLSCREDIGDVAANKLVDQCIKVSPATHPPCNAANTCEMIRDEIRRSCAMSGDDPGMKQACAGA